MGILLIIGSSFGRTTLLRISDQQFHSMAFVIYAILSFTSIIGYATGLPITAIAFFAWGPILLALAIMLALYFRKENQGYQIQY